MTRNFISWDPMETYNFANSVTEQILPSFVKDPQCNFILLDKTYCRTHKKLTP